MGPTEVGPTGTTFVGALGGLGIFVGMDVGKGGAAMLVSVDGMQYAVKTLVDTQPCHPAAAGKSMYHHRSSLLLPATPALPL